MEDERFVKYKKMPSLILDMMTYLCETRFFKKEYEHRREFYEDINEKWKFVDFVIIEGTLEKPIRIKIGTLPYYKGDHEKSLFIDFNNKDNCYVTRGYAVGLYANKVIENRKPLPKYMQERIYKFIEGYGK